MGMPTLLRKANNDAQAPGVVEEEPVVLCGVIERSKGFYKDIKVPLTHVYMMKFPEAPEQGNML